MRHRCSTRSLPSSKRSFHCCRRCGAAWPTLPADAPTSHEARDRRFAADNTLGYPDGDGERSLASAASAASAVRRGGSGLDPTHASASSPERPKTRIGRVVEATGGGPPPGASPEPEQPHGRNWLRDVILGGQDGLVNILGIILGVIAGGGSRTVLISAGFAAAITESISMGAVGYTSSVAERDYYEAQRDRELREIETKPEEER